MYRETLDRVIQFFTKSDYQPQLDAAKNEYFQRTGKVFEDDPSYEVRMTAFLEWYLLDRVLWDCGVPPIRLYNEMFCEESGPDEREILRGLEASLHTLCSYCERDGEIFRVKDLFGGRIWEVRERRVYAGVEKGDLLDARIIPLKGGKNLFSDAFWFHPRDAKAFLLREQKAYLAKSPESVQDFLMDTAYMKLKHERFKHVPVSQVYNWESFRRDRNEAERHFNQKAEGTR